MILIFTRAIGTDIKYASISATKLAALILFFFWELEKKKNKFEFKVSFAFIWDHWSFPISCGTQVKFKRDLWKSGCSIGWLTYRCNICFYIAFWIIEIEKKKAKRMETFKPHLSTYNSYVYLHLYKVIVLYSF